MSKYKLINKTTGDQILCDKVTIDGFDYYVSDEKPKIGDIVIEKYVDGTIGLEQIDTLNDIHPLVHKKVIATNNLNIDVPKVVDEVDRLSFEDIIDYKPFEEVDGYKDYARYGYVKGYKKSQETHPFSEEDMIEFAEWCKNLQKDSKEIRRSNPSITTKELLQIWKEQKPKIVYYG